MEFALIGHLIGDFLIPTNIITENEGKSNKYLMLHCVIYAICVLGTMAFIIKKDDIGRVVLCVGVLSVIHGLIDKKKNQIEIKKKMFKLNSPVLFLLDQMMKITCLYVIFLNANITKCTEIQIFSIVIELKKIEKFLCFFIVYLVCWKPAACFIADVFKEIPNTTDENMNENINIGSWIGILEREIILILGCMGQYGTIGFVLAAKSIARYKQLEEKVFAEKYLIGTLLSAFIALCCVAVISLKFRA